jgi:hypothetical protein
MLRAIVRRLRRTTRDAVARLRPWRRQRWAIKISSPSGAEGDVWGDTAFAQDLATALRGHGQEVFIDRLGTRERPDSRHDDVVLVLRGLDSPPLDGEAINLLWVISHPDLVTDAEISSGYDAVFAASARWARERSLTSGVRVRAMLQATNPSRFTPGPATPSMTTDLLFVGTTRGHFRPIVRDAIRVGSSPTLFGHGWEEFVDPGLISAVKLDNRLLPDAYRSARIVLNDHWEDMRSGGFISNRIFDAAATGACIVSDPIEGAEEIFGGLVKEYHTDAELREHLSPNSPWPDIDLRRELAAGIAREHSFDRRAQTLVEVVDSLRR